MIDSTDSCAFRIAYSSHGRDSLAEDDSLRLVDGR